MSDAVSGWLAGNEAEVNAVFARYYPKAVRFAALSGLTLDDAQDCAQEAFVLAFQRRHQLRDARAFPLWFQRIVTSRVMEALGARQRRGELPLTGAEEASEDWQRHGSATPEDVVLGAEQRAELWHHVQTLPTKPRMALVLRYYGDFSLHEVAEILDMREGAVRVMLHRTLARLRALPAMQQEGQPTH